MAVFTGKTFHEEVVNLDDNVFENCTFRSCEMVYSGGPPVMMDSCRFESCRWRLTGAAERTMQFLKSLYHGAGEGGRQLVEQAFQELRRPV